MKKLMLYGVALIFVMSVGISLDTAKEAENAPPRPDYSPKEAENAPPRPNYSPMFAETLSSKSQS